MDRGGLNSSVEMFGGESDRQINNKTSHGGFRSKTKKMNVDIDLEGIRHHSTARARRTANVELGREQTWENAETPKAHRSDEDPEPDRINIDSEEDLMSNADVDSDAPDFLEMVLPMPKL